jgi:hypothetical protein
MKGRPTNPLVELADGEYMTEKAKDQRITIRMIERRLGLRARQLANYRANHYSR